YRRSQRSGVRRATPGWPLTAALPAPRAPQPKPPEPMTDDSIESRHGPYSCLSPLTFQGTQDEVAIHNYEIIEAVLMYTTMRTAPYRWGEELSQPVFLAPLLRRPYATGVGHHRARRDICAGALARRSPRRKERRCCSTAGAPGS